MNRREFLRQAAAAGVVAINGVAITEAVVSMSEPEMEVIASAKFIPELWSQEVLKAYKANLVMSALTK
jgi:hypothetical protein